MTNVPVQNKMVSRYTNEGGRNNRDGRYIFCLMAGKEIETSIVSCNLALPGL